MGGWRPIKRRDFVRKLRGLGFDGPISGTKHQFLIFGRHHQTIPSNAEFSVPQLRMLLHAKSGRSLAARFNWMNGIPSEALPLLPFSFPPFLPTFLACDANCLQTSPGSW